MAVALPNTERRKAIEVDAESSASRAAVCAAAVGDDDDAGKETVVRVVQERMRENERGWDEQV